ncbi:glycosyltransferase family 2 protein, partial [Streptococcus suis]
NDSDLSGGLLATFDGNYQESELQKCQIDLEEIKEVRDLGNENFPNHYMSGIFNSPCCKLYKNIYINKGFDTEQWLGEDLLFNLNYLKNIKKVSYVNRNLYFARRGIQSTTNTFKKDVFIQLENLEEKTFDLFVKIFGGQYEFSVFKETLQWHIIYYSLLMFKNGDESLPKKLHIFKYLYNRHSLDTLSIKRTSSVFKRICKLIVANNLFKIFLNTLIREEKNND